MYIPLVLVMSYYVSGVISGILGPCKMQDNECLQKTFSETLPLVISGIPSLGVDKSDPMFEKLIEGNLSILKYKLINATITGYKHCSLLKANFRFDVDALKLNMDLHCFNISMEGDYETSGTLVILPVEGEGTFRITSSKYFISINADLKMIEDAGKKSYVNIKNFKLQAKVLGPMRFEFNNLFNGQKDLSDAVHKFAHENYMAVAELVQDSILNPCLKSIVTNVNKFLKTQPLQEIFIDFV